MGQTVEKQHTCNGCGCVFRYQADAANWDSFWVSRKTKEEGALRCRPCPDCGMYQPEMVVWYKIWHGVIFPVALLVLLGIACAGVATGGRGALLAAQVGVGFFVAYGLVHLTAALNNPNADLAGNRELAERMIQEGKLERYCGGAPGSASPPPNLTRWHLAGLLLMLLGPAGFLYAVVELSDPTGTPVNQEGCEPAVLAPGDKVKFTFENCPAKGLNRLWRGTPTVRVLNANALGLPEALPAKGSEDRWGDKLSEHRRRGNQPVRPMISFTLPDDPRLANQTVRLHVTMPITFPSLRYRGSLTPDFTSPESGYFADETYNVSEHIALKVGDPAAVAVTRNAFLVGLAGGAAALAGEVWLLCLLWRMGRRASKSEIVREPEPESPPRCPGEYGLPGLAGHPALDDVDRSKWGDRHLR